MLKRLRKVLVEHETSLADAVTSDLRRDARTTIACEVCLPPEGLSLDQLSKNIWQTCKSKKYKLNVQYIERQHLVVSIVDKHLFQIAPVIMEIDYALANLKSWSQTEVVQRTATTMLDTPLIYNEPYGVVLVIGAW